MYIKAVEMENFKNYTRRVVFEFKNGFNGIAGPNGSGKSNLTDAILFVFGPKSTSKLRASRLIELVWSGSENSAPANECTVSIVFDNSRRELNIDADEVKLTRRIKVRDWKKGKVASYFYINGKMCQQSDFHEILAQIHLSPDGYNIIQQGDVAGVITKTKHERRKIIDDVAGVSKYDGEIDKAMKARERVNSNMEQTRVILGERSSQLKELEGERRTALKYMELQRRLKYHEWQYLYCRLSSKKRELEFNREEIEKIDASIQKNEKDVIEFERNMAVLERKIKEIEAEIEARMGDEERALNEKKNTIINELVNKKAALSTALDFIARNENFIRERKGLIKKGKKELSQKKAEYLDIKKKYDALNRERDDLTKRREELNRQLSASDEAIRGLNREIEDLKVKRGEKEAEIKELEKDRSHVEGEIEALLKNKARVEQDISNLKGECEDAEWRLKDLKLQSKGLEGKMEELRRRRDELLDREAKLQVRKEKLETRYFDLNKEYNKLLSEQKIADYASERGRGVRAVLEANAKGILRGILGTVAELIEVEEEYKTAIAVAGGKRLEAIVVDNVDVGAEVLKYLKKNKLGRAAVLPLNKMMRGKPRAKALIARRDKACVGFATDLVTYDERIANVMWYVFGDTLVMKDLDSAKKYIGGVRMVTMDGMMIEALGAMIGGSMDKAGTKIQFGRNNAERLKSIEGELNALQSEIEGIKAEIPGIRSELMGIESELAAAGQREIEREIEKYEHVLINSKKRINEQNKMLERISKELDNKKDESETIARKIASVKDEIMAIDAEIGEKEREKDTLVPKNISSELDMLGGKLYEVQKNLMAVSESKTELEIAIKNYNEKLEAYNNEVLAAEKEYNEKKREAEALQRSIKVMESEIEKIDKRIEEMNKEIHHLRNSKDGIKTELHNIQRAIEQKKREINNWKDDKISRNATITQIEGEISSIVSEIRDLEGAMREKGIDLGEEKREELLRNLPSLTDLDRRIRDIKKSIEDLGTINQTAIEKYDRLSKQIEELQKKLKDFEEESNAWLKVENQLRTKRLEVFMYTFQRISENFKNVFKEVCEGGEGELVLENPENPFEGGLEIKVKLPGQKARRIDTLSGGEKSFTALALIFAIQRYMPSPMYIFDEVDQNLDPINCEKISRMIKIGSETAQFVVISHHKVMLKEADMIYGVTKRRKDGVAEVYALDVSQLLAEDRWESNRGGVSEEVT